MKKYFVLLTIAVLIITLLRVNTVSAQEQSGDSLKSQYKNLLNSYGLKDQQYRISYQQFVQLRTLASQEEMVKKAKDALLERANLLDTYLNYLSQTLAQTKGVELSRLEAEQQKIAEERLFISEHRQKITSMTDRVELHNESQAFQERKGSISSAAFRAMALIKIAQIQHATDQIQAPIDMIKSSLEGTELDQVKIEEKKRGLVEIDRQISLVKQSLQTALDQYDSSSKSNAFDLDTYGSITNILDSGYAKTKLVLSYVQELSK